MTRTSSFSSLVGAEVRDFTSTAAFSKADMMLLTVNLRDMGFGDEERECVSGALVNLTQLLGKAGLTMRGNLLVIRLGLDSRVTRTSTWPLSLHITLVIAKGS